MCMLNSDLQPACCQIHVPHNRTRLVSPHPHNRPCLHSNCKHPVSELSVRPAHWNSGSFVEHSWTLAHIPEILLHLPVYHSTWSRGVRLSQTVYPRSESSGHLTTTTTKARGLSKRYDGKGEKEKARERERESEKKKRRGTVSLSIIRMVMGSHVGEKHSYLLT